VIPSRNGDVYNFVVAWPEQSSDQKKILLTQKDVRELQLAKGAVAAGIQMLMRQLDVRIEDIDVIYLAGALGNYVNPYSAMRIGLVPITAVEKIVSLGNAASAGAKMALLSKRHWQKATDIVAHIEHLELSIHPEFCERFVAAMDFPAQNLW
jgi:uncharacterized 2Fe-2S/4Fe-4S cluster protein (DUF4445 family)